MGTVENKRKNIGAVITVAAGIMWGFSGACGQYIFERFTIEPGASHCYSHALRGRNSFVRRIYNRQKKHGRGLAIKV